LVFVDTDVLSIFAKIQQLPLLFAVFNQERLHIALAVENEVKMGALKGFHVAQDITVLLTQKQIQTHRPLPIDDAFLKSLPYTLAAGERESMAICKRFDAVFASNERRVKHHCQANGIRCINLAEILRSFWKLEILSKTDVRQIITEIEIKIHSNSERPIRFSNETTLG
jgi:predicted nucleic acid-binding protein